MTISLYAASVPTYVQGLTGLVGVLDKGRAHCEAHGIDLADIVETRFHPDMQPFRYQIVAAIHHSVGAVAALKGAVFHPPGDKTPYDYLALEQRLREARESLSREAPAEIDARSGAEVVFEVPGVRQSTYSAEGFLLSFSLPNFYFHSATAYDILRSKGVPLTKRDYLGPRRPTV